MTDQELLAAIAQQESGGDPNAVGKNGEIGKYQFMPATLKALGSDVKVKGNAEAQDALAKKHLAGLRSRYGQDDEKVIAAWNAGEGGVDNAVKKAGSNGDWRQFLPKGTNAAGAQYDTAAYVQGVSSRVQPQEAQQAPAQPQQQQQPEVTPAAYFPGPRRRVNPEIHVQNQYQADQDAEVMNFLSESSARSEKAKAEKAAQPAAAPAPAEQPKPGFFDSVGSAFKNFVYPAAPVPNASPARKIMENAAGTMATGGAELIPGLMDFLRPSPAEAQRRSQLPIGQQVMEFGQHALKSVGDAINATPLGGAIGAGGAAIGQAATAAAAPDLSDEKLRTHLEQLKQDQAAGVPEASSSPELGGDIGGAGLEPRAQQIAGIESLLRMPMDERVRHAEEALTKTGEMIVGAAPLPMVPGAAGLASKLSGPARAASAAAKDARIATVAAAGEKAIAQDAKLATASAADKLRALETDPAAKAAIDETFAAAAPEAKAATPAVEKPKPPVVNDIIEDTTFDGKSKRATMGPNDNMVVARDAEGKDLGYLWYSKENGGGYTIRKLEVKPEYQRQGVASWMEDQVAKVEGPYKGATDRTAEGVAYRTARGGEPKLQRAPEDLYRNVRDAMHGDLDLTEATLKSRGYSMPDIGQAENAALHEAMGLGRDASPAEKMAAQDVLAGAAHDIGIVPEAATEALPAVNAIAKDIPKGDMKTLREIVADALKGGSDSPLAALRAVQNARGQEGKISAGVMFTLGRAALGGILGGMQGDTPEDHIKYALLGAGVGSVLSPQLAVRMAKNLENPAVRDALTNALTLHGETGAFKLRFPSRSVGEGTNTRTMGTSTGAKALVRGINEQLSNAGLLDRTEVLAHADVRAAAAVSKYKTVENILSLDAAKLSLDELPEAGLAARTARDASAERSIELGAHAKLNPTLENQMAVIDQAVMTSKLSQQIENLKTAYGRGLNAMGITTDVTQASKFELGSFAKELEAARAEMLARGNVTPAQFVDMVMDLADKSSAAKIANTGMKWPEALWNIYYGLNLLGSPLTHMRNLIGNTGALTMAVIDRAGGELLSMPFRALGGGKNMVQSGETMQLIQGIFGTVADSFRAGGKKGAFGYASDAYKSGTSVFGGSTKNAEAMASVTKALAEGSGTVPGIVMAMSSLAQKNMKLMSSADEFYKVLSFQGELRALAQRETAHLTGSARSAAFDALMQDPSRAMLQGANDFAHENTFTKAFKEGTFGKWLEKGAQQPVIKALVAPFYRTPVRISEFSTVHTPILNMVAKQTYSDLAAGGAKANLAVAKMVTGLGIMGLVGHWAAQGYITGMGPSDPALLKTMTDNGWKPKSIWMWDHYVSYDNFEPMSTIVGTMASFMEAAPDMDAGAIQNFWSAGASAIGRNALSKQWFQGIIDITDGISGITKGDTLDAAATWGTRKLAAGLPGAATWRYIQNNSAPEKLDSKSVSDNEHPELREWEKYMNIIRQNVPGWGGHDVSELAGYKPKAAVMNPLTGEAIPNENQWLGFALPMQISKLTDNWAIHESVRLSEAGGGNPIPPELPRVIGGAQGPGMFKLNDGGPLKNIREGIRLTDDERHRLGVILTKEIEDYEGRNLNDSINSLKNDETYQDASDTGKASMMSNRYRSFLEMAEDKLRGEYKNIDVAVQMRKTDRDLNKFPKSMEDLKDPIRQQVLQNAGQGR